MSPAALDGINLFEALPDACLITDSSATVGLANLAARALLASPSIEGRALGDLVDEEARDVIHQHLARLEQRQSSAGELELCRADGARRHVLFSVSRTVGEADTLVWLLRDGTSHWNEDQRLQAWLGLLRLLSERRDLDSALVAALHYLQDLAGCEAAGLRLEEGNDFPYFTTDGFPEHFEVAETRLCVRDPDGGVVRDRKGHTVLACMCGCVIRGRVDPEMPFFTRGGSFWTNSTTELLEDDRLIRPRNTCNSEGYESVALVPLRKDEQTFGLIQLNDRHRGRFTPELIELLEELSGFVAGVLA